MYYFPDGQDPISSISGILRPCVYPYVRVHSFISFLEKGIHKNEKAEDQVNFKQAMQRVIFKYFRLFLFSTKALARTSTFFVIYLDKDSEDCMFTEGILKA